jgi:hypothetical protein
MNPENPARPSSWQEQLEVLELLPPGVFWNPEWRARAATIAAATEGRPALLWLQYVLEGGARDVATWLGLAGTYEEQFAFRQDRGWPIPAPNADAYREHARPVLARLGLEERIFPATYCPFMKARSLAVTLLDIASYGAVEDATCYVLQGVRAVDFQLTDERRRERDEYLRRIKILNE